MADSYTIDEPMDLIQNCMNEDVYIKCRNNTELKGKLVVFDTHSNILLKDAEEIIQQKQEDGTIEVQKRNLPMVFMRGDAIILISPVAKGIL